MDSHLSLVEVESEKAVTATAAGKFLLDKVPIRKGNLWGHLLGLFVRCRMDFTGGGSAVNQAINRWLAQRITWQPDTSYGSKSKREHSGIGLMAMFLDQIGRSRFGAASVTNVDYAATAANQRRNIIFPLLFWEPLAIEPYDFVQPLAHYGKNSYIEVAARSTAPTVGTFNDMDVRVFALVHYIRDYLVGADTESKSETSTASATSHDIDPGTYARLLISNESETGPSEHDTYTSIQSDDGLSWIPPSSDPEHNDYVQEVLYNRFSHKELTRVAHQGVSESFLDYSDSNGPTLDLIRLVSHVSPIMASRQLLELNQRTTIKWAPAATTDFHFMRVIPQSEQDVIARARKAAECSSIKPVTITAKPVLAKKGAVTQEQLARVRWLSSISRKVEELSNAPV